MSAGYVMLDRQIGQRYLNLIISIVCHAWDSCASPQTRNIKLLQIIKKEIRIYLAFIYFRVIQSINSPKWFVCVLDVIKRAFPRQEYTCRGVESRGSIAHNTTATIHRNRTASKLFVIPTITYFQKFFKCISHLISTYWRLSVLCSAGYVSLRRQIKVWQTGIFNNLFSEGRIRRLCCICNTNIIADASW